MINWLLIKAPGILKKYKSFFPHNKLCVTDSDQIQSCDSFSFSLKLK